jgi:hypothetical protein
MRTLAGMAALAILLWSEDREVIRFVDVTASAGITARMRCGGKEKQWIPEANGSGTAWLDFDRDGLMDLLIVNGSEISDLREIVSGRIPQPRPGSVYLYRNLGGGRFVDVTEKAGLSNPYWGTGANAADFDNDGYVDILITSIGRDLLYRNNRNGTFTEVGASAGLSRRLAWHTGSAFGDYDGDGFLDLYVAGYVALEALKLDGPAPVCNYRGLAGFCGPRGLKGEADILYRNNGDGTFTDVTTKAGVADRALAHGFTVVFDDFNRDGKIDIFVANDSDPNYLYLNRGDGTFEEAGLASGVAFSGDGNTQANMGVAVGEFTTDALPSLLTTTFSEDYFPLFKQQRPGFFEDVSASAGLAQLTIPWVGWSCGFADFDNGGTKELWIANGHVYPDAARLTTTTYNQPLVVLKQQSGQFVRVPGIPGGEHINSYRGGAAGDFNNDGRMDLIVLPISGSPLLLENRTLPLQHWLGLKLQGTASNRDAVGANVRVSGCGAVQTDSVRSGGSYLSRNDPRLHFGLNSCTEVDDVKVRWPNGKQQQIRRPGIDRYVEITEP